jgi:hypothetical protein
MISAQRQQELPLTVLLVPVLLLVQTWTMILEFNDTPEGLVVDIEVVAGGFRV